MALAKLASKHPAELNTKDVEEFGKLFLEHVAHPAVPAPVNTGPSVEEAAEPTEDDFATLVDSLRDDDCTDWQCPYCKRYEQKAFGYECEECGFDAKPYLQEPVPVAPTDAAPLNTGTAERAEEGESLVRSSWSGVHLDGRNEHGSHVLPLPQSYIGELKEEDLETVAEEILKAAEADGYEVGNAVVCTFKWVREEYHHGYWEFESYSPELTRLIYGTPEEQSDPAHSGDKGGQPESSATTGGK